MLFPDSCEWFIVIDETIDGGIGILAGRSEFIEAFRTQYQPEEQDLNQFVQFCNLDHIKRGVSLEPMHAILRLLGKE